MKINLYYNDFKKEIDIIITNKIGVIQENILNYCSLMIYDIEYSEIMIDNNSYVLGDEEFDFNNTLEFVLKNLDKELIHIQKIIIYDRKRDIYGNVIQNNSIINNYNKWYTNYENENYINIINDNNNHRVIRFPLSIMLNNILNIQTDIIEDVQQEEAQQEEEEQQEEAQQEDGSQNAYENRFLLNTELNDFVHIFDNYIRNTDINYEYFDIQQLLDVNENITTYNLFSNYEDVKIILKEEEFNNLETIIYDKLNYNDNDECLICTEQFVDNDIIKKIKCNHLFHTHCIKPWLCEESNKCPICRVEAVDKK